MNTIELKYPVVLVHGIAAKDSNQFWGRIVETLKEGGVEVFLGNTDSWASIEHNALRLRRRINHILKQTGKEKVNIIAHSKGGIDSRYLISSLKYERIASLTTISTPHRGSEIADYVFSKEVIKGIISIRSLRKVFRLYGDRIPDPYTMLKNLTTSYMEEFNRNNPDNESVYYSSYHSVLEGKMDDLPYYYTFQYLKKIAGANDGLVSTDSAEWGSEFNIIKGLSHSEILDYKRKTISGIDVPRQYLAIARKLAELGF